MMIRLWLLMWYFTRPDRPNESNAPSWCRDNITRSHLWLHLAYSKGFAKNWRLTLRDLWYWRVIRKPLTSPTEFGQKMTHRQMGTIYDLIDKAINMGFLIKSDLGSEIHLTTDYRGRDFVYNPLAFLNAVFKEYGYFYSFIFGIGGTLLVTFWKEIIALTAK